MICFGQCDKATRRQFHHKVHWPLGLASQLLGRISVGPSDMEPFKPPPRVVSHAAPLTPHQDHGPAQTLAHCLDAVLVSGMELARRAISGALDRQAAASFEAATPARIRQAMARWLQGSLALTDLGRLPSSPDHALPDMEALAARLGLKPGRGVSILAEELALGIRPLGMQMPRLSPGLDPDAGLAWFCLCAIGAIEAELEVRRLQPLLRGVILEAWPELIEQSLRLVAPQPARPSRLGPGSMPAEDRRDFRPAMDASSNRRDLLRRPSREREREATLAVTDLLQRKIVDQSLPESVTEFLQAVWVRHLRTTVLRDGKSSPNFLHALGVVDDLIWTLNEAQIEISRDQLALRIPVVVQTLDAGARSVGLSDAQMQPFMDALFLAHLKRMQRSPAKAGDALVRILREIRVDDCPEAGRPVPVTGKEVFALQPGHWIQLHSGDQVSRMKVAWFNADRSVFLMVRAGDRRAVSVRGSDLQEQLSRQSAVLLV